MLGVLRHHWAPEAFVISFKLETDERILMDKVAPVSCQAVKRNLISKCRALLSGGLQAGRAALSKPASAVCCLGVEVVSNIHQSQIDNKLQYCKISPLSPANVLRL